MALDDAAKGGGKRRRGRAAPKGRHCDDAALAGIRALLGQAPRRRDLLIEHLHRIQDAHGHLSARHLRALAEEMRLPMAAIWEVATFYAHFDPRREDEAPPPATTIRVCDSLAWELAGLGSAKCSNEEAYLFQTPIRRGFGHENLDHCTRLCHASSVAALMENGGSGAVTATFNDIAHAGVAIVVGASPVENHPVAATYFKQFAARGGTLIVMDPRGQALRRYATHMLQFRPGADVAPLDAIMHVIVDEGMVDRQYVEGVTENWAAQEAHLAGFAPETVEGLTGIDAGTVRAVARAFARGRADMVFWGMGISQHVHGTDKSRCLIALALMCGHVGRPGTGLHPLRGQNDVQGASDAGLAPMFLPDYSSVTGAGARARFADLWGVEPDARKGPTVTEIMDAVHDGEIHAMVVLGENPVMPDPDLSHARAAMAKLDHLVVQDIFLTETATFADVILPASAWFEKTGTVTNTNRQVQMGRPAVPPPGQAREDCRIVQDLARRCGLHWAYDHPRDVVAEMAQVMPSLADITWDRLAREGAVTDPSLSPDDPGQPIVFGERFPRAARSDRAVAPDMVSLPFAYAEAAANLPTNPAIDPYGKIPAFRFVGVRVGNPRQDAAA